MVIDKLDFTGGPWKLRNGDKVNGVIWSSDLNRYISDNWVKDNREWDILGNCYDDPKYDLVENLNNWKHLRYDQAN